MKSFCLLLAVFCVQFISFASAGPCPAGTFFEEGACLPPSGKSKKSKSKKSKSKKSKSSKGKKGKKVRGCGEERSEEKSDELEMS